MNIRAASVSVILIATLLLTSCGFQLRGTIAIPTHLQPIAINDETNDRDLKRSIMEIFKNNHVALATSSIKPNSVLTLKELHLQEQIVSVSSGVGAKQYQLNLLLKYEWFVSGDHTPAQEHVLQLARQYTQNMNRILGSSDEKEQLILEMKKEMSIIITKHAN